MKQVYSFFYKPPLARWFKLTANINLNRTYYLKCNLLYPGNQVFFTPKETALQHHGNENQQEKEIEKNLHICLHLWDANQLKRVSVSACHHKQITQLTPPFHSLHASSPTFVLFSSRSPKELSFQYIRKIRKPLGKATPYPLLYWERSQGCLQKV